MHESINKTQIKHTEMHTQKHVTPTKNTQPHAKDKLQ